MIGGVFIFLLLGTPSVDFVQTKSVPSSAIDQHGNSFTVTGLSGLAWDTGTTWYAVMDNSQYVVTLQVIPEITGAFTIAMLQGVRLERYGDYEDIAVTSDGCIVLTDETTQDIHVFDPVTGALQVSYPLHPIYQEHRTNLGCESLCIVNGVTWIANEEALTVDGPTSTPEIGTVVRLSEGLLDSLPLAKQVAYEVTQMHGPYIPKSGAGLSGLVAISQLPSGRLLTLERSLAFIGAFFELRIYVLDTTNATDVRAFQTLTNSTYIPAEKQLLYFGTFGNMEGLALGPQLSEETYLLMGIVDDGDPLSSNRIQSFLVTETVCPEDLNFDGTIGTSDLLNVISEWGSCSSCAADFNNDSYVDVVDLLQVVSLWGPC